VRSQEEEQDEPVLAIHEQEPPDYTPVASEQHESPAVAEVAEVVDSAEAEEVHEDAQIAAEPVIAEQEEDEEVELRVAISGKASREEPGNVNITSIFSQASRAKQEALAQEAESSSSSSRRKGMASSAAPTTTEAMQNLTSFVKSKEERSSQLKMCIIQRDETLEHIAQRYSMPVSKIVEVNRLATEQLVAGQILYIPQ